ncbi:hypothetical protein CEP52_010849 [Fusarium oligoseptatum]|uniref:Uncharacterized protein n=1 Tax=Fusarium oligoseptatum TaxID=2604345 RepID=A0A428T662_9HYPO|nr:hypothetical protein CEP52_010849 [Fusarium oligoseptatum]
MQKMASKHLSWQRISFEIGSHLSRVKIPELELHLNDPTSEMAIDTFPQYRLRKSDLIAYLKSQFPEESNAISVQEHGSEYVLKIPQKLTSAQRTHIFKHVHYRSAIEVD